MSFELSPSLARPEEGEERSDAFELKYNLAPDQADWVEAWARARLTPDSHGDRGRYQVTTLYCDTPAFGVFHRSAGCKRSKFRLRRYGQSHLVHVERKRRKGDIVRKRREALPAGELTYLWKEEPPQDWPAFWFRGHILTRGLQPSCLVNYTRTAFAGTSPTGATRLTLDRDLLGEPASGWQVELRGDGKPLLSGAVLELKFHATLPPAFVELLSGLTPLAEGDSKYRRCVRAWGLAGGEADAPRVAD
jgi:hypothetical protein